MPFQQALHIKHPLTMNLIYDPITLPGFPDPIQVLFMSDKSAGQELHKYIDEVNELPPFKLERIERIGPEVGLIHRRVPSLTSPVQVLLCLDEQCTVSARDGKTVRFVWLLFSNARSHPNLGAAVEFANLMKDTAFRHQGLKICNRKRFTSQALEEFYIQALTKNLKFERQVPPELRRSGGFMGGLKRDLHRRARHYWDDFLCGIDLKSLAATIFLFFACIAPSIAFGGLLSVQTEGSIGVIEMLVGTALCGMIYALFSGQPLTILGSTGPVIAFVSLLYPVCQDLGIPYLPTLFWIGMWTSFFILIVIISEACSLMRYFTRFTDETFAALISLIFIYESVSNIYLMFHSPSITELSALFSFLLAIGTFRLTRALTRFRRGIYLSRPTREFLADFSPTISIVVMSYIAFRMSHIPVTPLDVPDSFSTTSGRSWIVNPLEAPSWVWWSASLPALLFSILVYLDQNITVRLVNNGRFNLKKGAGYHLDMTVIAVLIAICSIFGLPWMVAATVRSLNHVRALSETEINDSGEEVVKSVRENRLTGFAIHLLIGGSLFFLVPHHNLWVSFGSGNFPSW